MYILAEIWSLSCCLFCLSRRSLGSYTSCRSVLEGTSLCVIERGLSWSDGRCSTLQLLLCSRVGIDVIVLLSRWLAFRPCSCCCVIWEGHRCSRKNTCRHVCAPPFVLHMGAIRTLDESCSLLCCSCYCCFFGAVSFVVHRGGRSAFWFWYIRMCLV